MLNWISVVKSDRVLRNRGYLMQPGFYWEFVARRWPYIVIPFLLVSLIGVVFVRNVRAAYLSEGKLIVQPQQVSTELVRATVTSSAQDRLQLIQQRTMSRDSVLEIADKYDLFPDARRSLTTNDFVELVKRNIRIAVIEITPEFGQRSRGTNPPFAFSVGFEYSDPSTAQKVANELIQRFMDQDIRDRKERAHNTTKFMTDEYEKLRTENAVLEARVAERRAKIRTSVSSANGDSEKSQLTQLKEELAQKSALYSDQHPLMKSLRRQIQLLGAASAQDRSANTDAASLEMLSAQQDAARKALEQAAAKMSAALAGENLERNQQSEKLEILESATVPQQSLKPNGRLKMLASIVAAALMSGLILAFLVEALDTGIRSSRDIAIAIDRNLVTTIPYIAVPVAGRRRSAAKFLCLALVVAVLVVVSLSASTIGLQPLNFVSRTDNVVSR